MKAIAVVGLEAQEITQQVRKVLRGLGNPEPPLRLADVRELLRLDKQYYSSKDTGFVREIVSRIKVAGKQVVHRPTLLWDAIRKAELSALYLPDKRRILIDADKPQIKHRWSEAHEIIHSLIEWHGGMNLGDTSFTLNPHCHQIIEAEANFGAGQILFLQQRFIAEARDCVPTIDSIKTLAGRYGNTVTSTLWRYVESANVEKPTIGIVSQHPRFPKEDFDPQNPCKYCIQSARFRAEFSNIPEIGLFRVIQDYCGYQRRGPLGESEVRIVDDNGQPHLFHFETFFNYYEALTIGTHLRPCK